MLCVAASATAQYKQQLTSLGPSDKNKNNLSSPRATLKRREPSVPPQVFCTLSYSPVLSPLCVPAVFLPSCGTSHTLVATPLSLSDAENFTFWSVNKHIFGKKKKNISWQTGMV